MIKASLTSMRSIQDSISQVFSTRNKTINKTEWQFLVPKVGGRPFGLLPISDHPLVCQGSGLCSSLPWDGPPADLFSGHLWVDLGLSFGECSRTCYF